MLTSILFYPLCVRLYHPVYCLCPLRHLFTGYIGKLFSFLLPCLFTLALLFTVLLLVCSVLTLILSCPSSLAVSSSLPLPLTSLPKYKHIPKEINLISNPNPNNNISKKHLKSYSANTIEVIPLFTGSYVSQL